MANTDPRAQSNLAQHLDADDPHNGASQFANLARLYELNSGETALPRVLGWHDALGALGTGSMYLTFFKAAKSEAITQIKVATSGTAAAATPSLCRLGIYALTGTTNTLVASTVSDTALFAAANTFYTKALSATWQKQQGQVYVCALLVVTAAAAPSFTGWQLSPSNLTHDLMTLAPYVSGAVTGQADLPASFDISGITGVTRAVQFVMLP